MDIARFLAERLAAAQALLPPEAIQELCGTDVPGGEYGAEISDTMRQFSARFGPRAELPPRRSEEDQMHALEYVQSAIGALFDETVARINALTPPAEHAEGHAVIVTYFTGLAESSDLIDEAIVAVDREVLAAAIDRANGIAQEAFEGMPDDFREFAGPVF